MSTRLIPSYAEQEFQQLQAFIKAMFPNPAALSTSVSPELQQAELETLRQGRRAEQFFFVVDLPTLTVSNAAGLEEIGYNPAQFTFRKYLATIPSQGMLQLITLLGKLSFVMSDKPLLRFMNPKFIANIPLTNAQGQALLVKRTISTWQFTHQGQLTGYLSEFTILKPYENEPMNPRFLNMDPAIEAEFASMMAKQFANLSHKVNLLSHKEIDLMKLYIETDGQNLSVQALAKLARITVNTVHKHNQNILLKAKTMFGDTMPAKTARDMAFFLKKCGMLG